jgi:putative flippase GtrA
LSWKNKIQELLRLKIKYAASAFVATAVDYGVFFYLSEALKFSVANAQSIAYPVGVLVNFLLQRRFVFNQTRSLWLTFGLVVLVSTGGLLLSRFLMQGFTDHISFLNEYRIVAKVMTSSIVFFYNFYLKRYVFEGKLV